MFSDVDLRSSVRSELISAMAEGGLSSNPDNYPHGYLYEYSGQGLIAASVVFIFLELLFTGLRQYARLVKPPGKGINGRFIWLALVLNLAVCIERIGTATLSFIHTAERDYGADYLP